MKSSILMSWAPNLGLGDALETEILFDDVCGKFGVPEIDLLALWKPELSLGDLVRQCIVAGAASDAYGRRS